MKSKQLRDSGRAILALFLVLAMATCSPKVTEREDFKSHFDAAGYPGSLLLYNESENQFLAYNAARVDSAFLPASTFKIFNSLAALESGVAKDEKLVIPWDSTVRDIQAWNRDHDMASAIKVSCVPYYQEIARRVGREKMQGYLDQEAYGNATIGPEIDMFWLDGSLKISQMQQIDFLRKLRHDQLKFSKRNQAIVRTIMLTDSTPEYAIRSKTGWGFVKGRNYGWWVGWLEKGEKTCYFAVNIFSDAPGDGFGGARMAIVKGVLEELGWMK